MEPKLRGFEGRIRIALSLIQKASLFSCPLEAGKAKMKN
jgi:hypothetical protein